MTASTDRLFAAPSAQIASGARIGAGTHVWHQAQVADDVEIGTGCTLSTGCYVGSGSRIGDNVKIGNHADLFGAHLGDEVMISPQAVLTEDRTPRATRPDGQRQGPDDWTSTPVIVRRGATVGAGARIAPGVEIGQYALVGIGAVVLRDVAPHALVLGNPARAIGWVCRCAATLDGRMRCPRCGLAYAVVADLLVEISPGR
jgi:UDP-2-acetamido-3-amino-2,3-dideoxy-glucuronate N-acetyltransferase